jgi:hypothetical protein
VTKGILFVETWLSSPELAEEFHRQYNETHLKEMLDIDGYVSARRFEPLGHDGGFVAIYEIEADDLDAVQARLAETRAAGTLTTPTGVATEPRPVVRFYREIFSTTR